MKKTKHEKLKVYNEDTIITTSLDGSDIILQNDEKQFFQNKINPLLSYFFFTNKYIFKKKSTILFPIISFVVILVMSLVLKFFPTNNKEPNLSIFPILYPFIISTSILIIVMFATIKSLNLFKDISDEGLEILIVSKPIERWQIILIRFFYFLFLGFFICLVNYFALLIGLSISSNMIPNSFSIIKIITIYYFSMLLIYILFGSISILLSLKFSTKLVTSFSSSFLGLGLILSNVLPPVIAVYEINNGFEGQLNKQKSQNININFNPNFIKTDDGKIIIVEGNRMQSTLNSKHIKTIEKAFNDKRDLSWVSNLNNFINPISGITKIAS